MRMAVPEGSGDTELVVLEHSLSPRNVLGAYFFQRDESLIANAALGSDRLIQRTRIRLQLGDVVQSPSAVEPTAQGGEPTDGTR